MTADLKVVSELAAIATLSTILWWWSSAYDRAFLSVERGDTRDSVIARMGPPTETRRCAKNLWWDLDYLGENRGECVDAFF